MKLKGMLHPYREDTHLQQVEDATINGGYDNTASGNYSSINGGKTNETNGLYSAIAGGDNYTTYAPYDVRPPYTNMEYLPTYLTVDPISHSLVFEGANIYLRSGSGSSDDNGNLTGLGNLVIGYDENDGTKIKSGSHNLVVGDLHSYTGYSGIVSGSANTLSGDIGAVIGGTGNTASEEGATITGGYSNTASGLYSHVSSGFNNIASGDYSSVISGTDNTASGERSSTLSGYNNNAGAFYSAILGGHEAPPLGNIYSGGYGGIVTGNYSVVSGGINNTSDGNYAVVAEALEMKHWIISPPLLEGLPM